MRNTVKRCNAWRRDRYYDALEVGHLTCRAGTTVCCSGPQLHQQQQQPKALVTRFNDMKCIKANEFRYMSFAFDVPEYGAAGSARHSRHQQLAHTVYKQD